MTCLRRHNHLTRDTHPVEVYQITMWEVYDEVTARVIATFECRVEAEAYAATINGTQTPDDTSKECCQNG